jgi:hypothetical protein
MCVKRKKPVIMCADVLTVKIQDLMTINAFSFSSVYYTKSSLLALFHHQVRSQYDYTLNSNTIIVIHSLILVTLIVSSFSLRTDQCV